MIIPFLECNKAAKNITFEDQVEVMPGSMLPAQSKIDRRANKSIQYTTAVDHSAKSLLKVQKARFKRVHVKLFRQQVRLVRKILNL